VTFVINGADFGISGYNSDGSLRVAAVTSVPDSTSSALLLALGLGVLGMGYRIRKNRLNVVCATIKSL
jgi:hypothetical protein